MMQISNPVEIAKRIKEERERLGLTLLGMAEAAEVGRATQSNYEAGITHPGVDYIYRLKTVGVDTHYVLTGVKSDEVLSIANADLLWTAVDVTLRLREKIKHLPVSDEGLGLAIVRNFRFLSGELDAQSILTEGLLPSQEETRHER